MKSFQQFITEAYDKELEGQASRKPGEGGRIRTSRKKRDIDKTRVKAVGGGKTAPAADYKPRKDIGTNKPRSRHQQQPEKERGSAALSAREAQRKAARERRAAKSGAKTKTADELLSTKKKTVDPNYKPQKASGLTHRERLNLVKKGEKKLRDLRLQSTGKTKESELKYPVTQKEVSRRKKKAQ
tara:strand:- start:7 stop:558 length:552 start_codon:yes stop_codon:yes gene_type:complete